MVDVVDALTNMKMWKNRVRASFPTVQINVNVMPLERIAIETKSTLQTNLAMHRLG